ncbi:MAG: hypothetical protein AAB576_11100 [Elusimicrobiota bacterium]
MAKEKKVHVRIDLQCGVCGALTHHGESRGGKESRPEGPEYGAPTGVLRFCPACGAGFERYCIRCQKRVDMFFEEWWPDEEECMRTYTPAKRCPNCNAGLEVAGRTESSDSKYDH